MSSPCSCVRGRRSHLSLLGPETHCCCRSPSTSSWYLKQKHSHRWRQHCYYKLSGCVRPAGCGASSHLQGAARPVSAGCFCEMEGSFRSWRGLPETIPGGGTLPILRYKSSVSRFWLACRSCTSARCLRWEKRGWKIIHVKNRVLRSVCDLSSDQDVTCSLLQTCYSYFSECRFKHLVQRKLHESYYQLLNKFLMDIIQLHELVTYEGWLYRQLPAAQPFSWRRIYLFIINIFQWAEWTLLFMS